MEIDIEEEKRREREMNAAMEQIRSFHSTAKKGWTIDIPIWRLAIEGICTFMLAILVGLGLAIIYDLIFG